MEIKAKILLHVCCAPDFTVAAERMQAEFRLGAFFYNPNIFPLLEYGKRKFELARLAAVWQFELHEPEFDPQNWLEQVRGLEQEPEKGKRCEVCIRMRLLHTAQKALQLGYGLFATVLTASPHKNADLINGLGREIAQDAAIEYYSTNFKKQDGFKRSLELCRIYDVYRQNYCGCPFSIKTT